jgi:hypothetical protein
MRWPAAGLIATVALASKRARPGSPCRHLPRAQGQPAAIRGRRLQRTPGRQGAGAGARGWQAPRRAGDGRWPARGDRAKGLRPQDQGRCLSLAPACCRWRCGAGARLRQQVQGRVCRQDWASPPRPAGCWPRSSPRSRATSAPTAASSPPLRPSTSARASRPRRAAPGGAAALSRRPDKPPARRARPPQGAPAAPRWSSRALHRAARRAAGSRRLRPGGAPPRRRQAPGLARQPQGLHQPRVAHVRERRPEWGSQRDRVQVHAHRGAPRRQPGARQRRPEGQQLHQGPAGLRRRLQERRVPFIRVDG